MSRFRITIDGTGVTDSRSALEAEIAGRKLAGNLGDGRLRVTSAILQFLPDEDVDLTRSRPDVAGTPPIHSEAPPQVTNTVPKLSGGTG